MARTTHSASPARLTVGRSPFMPWTLFTPSPTTLSDFNPSTFLLSAFPAMSKVASLINSSKSTLNLRRKQGHKNGFQYQSIFTLGWIVLCPSHRHGGARWLAVIIYDHLFPYRRYSAKEVTMERILHISWMKITFTPDNPRKTLPMQNGSGQIIKF